MPFWFGSFSPGGFHETVFHGELTVVKDRLRVNDEHEVAASGYSDCSFQTVGVALIAPWVTVMCDM